MPKTPCPRRPGPDSHVVSCHCRFFRDAPNHHDLLVRVDGDVNAALELFELATTWEELDYREEALVVPGDWLEFASGHSWADPDLAERLFSVAVDVAFRRGAPTAGTRLLRVLAQSG